MTFLLHCAVSKFQIDRRILVAGPWGNEARLFLQTMGIVMKKLVLAATVLALTAGSALAADMRVKAVKAPPPPAFDPWDFAFGSSITNDYVFRGITQSNHKPSVSVYFEPRYNVTKDLQLYAGVAGCEHLVPEPRCRRNRLLRRYPPDLRHLRLRLRCLGIPLSWWSVL